MKPTTVACLALLCLAALVSSGSCHSLENDTLDINLEHQDALLLPKDNLPLTRGRCKTMGRCVHDAICEGHCKQWGYKDGSCSGDFCICCA